MLSRNYLEKENISGNKVSLQTITLSVHFYFTIFSELNYELYNKSHMITRMKISQNIFYPQENGHQVPVSNV